MTAQLRGNSPAASSDYRPGPPSGRLPGNLARMRLTVFWERMRAQFGEAYADSVAADYVLAPLNDRTAKQGLADGVDPKLVWLAVCEAFNVPERLR
jgi:hypothetical protein